MGYFASTPTNSAEVPAEQTVEQVDQQTNGSATTDQLNTASVTAQNECARRETADNESADVTTSQTNDEEPASSIGMGQLFRTIVQGNCNIHLSDRVHSFLFVEDI